MLLRSERGGQWRTCLLEALVKAEGFRVEASTALSRTSPSVILGRALVPPRPNRNPIRNPKAMKLIIDGSMGKIKSVVQAAPSYNRRKAMAPPPTRSNYTKRGTSTILYIRIIPSIHLLTHQQPNMQPRRPPARRPKPCFQTAAYYPTNRPVP